MIIELIFNIIYIFIFYLKFEIKILKVVLPLKDLKVRGKIKKIII